MATLIPTLGSTRFDSAGELRLAERLKDFLEDTAWAWHNLPVGPRGRHPDFVILRPARGILVLEARLTYVALTRATHEAFLTDSRESPVVGRLVG
jgi:hypothetical protein